MFRDREDAALQLADRLRGCRLRHPLVLAVPRGGAVIGAVLAQELGAEFDVILTSKIRAPWAPDVVVGAVSEDGTYFLNRDVSEVPGMSDAYVAEEIHRRLGELHDRRRAYRRARPQAAAEQRSVIVTDDGVATGATMTAALQTLQARHPFETIVAVPAAAPERIDHLRCWCDEVVCLTHAPRPRSVGQFYGGFPEVTDDEVVKLLLAAEPVRTETERAPRHGSASGPAGSLRNRSSDGW